jgi:hypothetical protein
MLIAWQNLADSAALSAGSELSTLPGTNVQQPHVSRKWGTAAGVKTSSLTLDMGSAVACAILALLGTNFTSAATLRLRASNTDPTATSSLLLDTGTIAAGVKAGYGAAYKAFASTTARYWRLDVSDTTVSDNLQVGRLVLGPSWQPSINQLYEWNVTASDNSRVTRSYGRQSHVELLPQERILAFTLDFMNESEMYGNAFKLAHDNGQAKDVLVIPDINGAFLSEQAVWGLSDASEALVHRASQIYRQKFTIRERL